MTLHIKNMVCLHCIMALKQLLKELDISYNHIELGAIILKEKLSKEKLAELSAGLNTLGLGLIDDRRSRIIEKIKTTIINLMHEDAIENKSSDVLVTKLKAHIEKDIREKYQLVQELSKTKDDSVAKGRA